ncbi:MAG: lactate racemase domain-containing protein [Planctomycetota bacterium]|jgi:nickel-dependent lactate racemase
MEVQLHYGRDSVRLEIPEANLAGFIRPRKGVGASTEDFLGNAISKASAVLNECIDGKCLGILLPDGTRDLPVQTVLSQLLPMCRKARGVLFFICTGTHTAETPGNQHIIDCIGVESAKAEIEQYEVIVHDCQSSPLVRAGSTQAGTEVIYNERLNEPDCFVVLSDVKHHYFAGYSNPIKNFMPGLCAFQTTRQNHSLTMGPRSRAGAHPWHTDPDLRDNPLACDQLEGMEMIAAGRTVFALVTISSDGAIQWADFGPAQTVTARAFDQADEWNCVKVGAVKKMIVSCGGLPNDVDLYIAQRALELTGRVVADGGQILFVAACPEGVGSERTRSQFYEKLICPLETITAADRQDYQLFSHKPWRFAQLIKRLDKLWLHSHIDAATIEKMHMHVCCDPKAVLNQWLADNPNEPVLIVDGANKLLLQIKPN